jgi:translation initiation factor 2D
VVQHSLSLSVGQLVCVTQYYPPVDGVVQIGPALAVGHMALAGDRVGRAEKGKAVNIVHTWKDHLWEMGGKEDPPTPRAIEPSQKTDPEVNDDVTSSGVTNPATGTTPENLGEGPSQAKGESSTTPPKEETNPLSQQGISPETGVVISPNQENSDVSELLQSALLQSIATTLSKLPASSFPISPSIFSETYILPYRSFKEVSATSTPVDIKHSGYKSLTAFLKSSAKEGLIKLKESKGEVVITGMYHLGEVQVFFTLMLTQVSTNHIRALTGTSTT